MKRNYIKRVTSFILLIVITIGCEKDFLNLEPPYSQDAENYFTTEEHYEQALIGAYDLLQASFLNLWIGEIASDNSIAGGESVTDTKGLHEIDDMLHGSTNIELRSIMRWYYSGITRVNFIMEAKDKLDFSGKENILAQARFLRGYYYFQLVKFFGPMPLVIDERIGADQVTEIERSSTEEIYAQIEEDLVYASTYLDWNVTEKGRISKGAAKSLLGKVLLYQEKYSEALSKFEEVINSGNYNLVNDYAELFTVAGEGNEESVFEIEYSGLEGGSYGCLICLEGNAAPGFQGIRQYSGPVYGDGNSYNLPTKELYNSFASGDLRKDLSILDIETFIASQPNPSSITYAIGGGGHTGYYNNKYIKRQGEIGLPDNDLTSPVNYRVIRYADVLLMASECANKSGNDASALKYVNQVRTRAGLPNLGSSGNTLYEEILDERRFELSGEGHRFFDLVRTGQAPSKISGFVAGTHELFPIPQVEIDLAGGNWTQNSGY